MDFKFQIGDLVEHVTAFHTTESVPIIGVVLEQKSQTCPGGTQFWYTVRFGFRKAESFLDIELRPHVPERDKSRDDIDRLDEAKGIAVMNHDFPTAASIRDLADRLKKERREKLSAVAADLIAKEST